MPPEVQSPKQEPLLDAGSQRSEGIDLGLTFASSIVALAAMALLLAPVRHISQPLALLYSAVGIPALFATSAWVLTKRTGLVQRLRLLSTDLTWRRVISFLALFAAFQLAARTLGIWLFPASVRQQITAIDWRWPQLSWALFRSVVGSPVTEEMLFRGWLLSWLWRRDQRSMLWGSITYANLLTSFLFALVHVPTTEYPGSLILIFFVSLLIGAARERTQSLALPMLLHFLTNFLGLVVFVG